MRCGHVSKHLLALAASLCLKRHQRVPERIHMQQILNYWHQSVCIHPIIWMWMNEVMISAIPSQFSVPFQRFLPHLRNGDNCHGSHISPSVFANSVFSLHHPCVSFQTQPLPSAWFILHLLAPPSLAWACFHLPIIIPSEYLLPWFHSLELSDCLWALRRALVCMAYLRDSCSWPSIYFVCLVLKTPVWLVTYSTCLPLLCFWDNNFPQSSDFQIKHKLLTVK